MQHSPQRTAFRTLALSLAAAMLTLLALFASLVIGSTSTSVAEVLSVLTGTSTEQTLRAIVVQVRLPRSLLALLTGGALAVSGVVFQALLRNVLAEPYILGVSGGASVGALIAIITGVAAVPFLLPVSAFAGALLVVLIVLSLGRSPGMRNEHALLLSGVMIGAFLSAIILALVSTSGPELRGALFWLIGFLGNARMDQVLVAATLALPVVALLAATASSMNILALGKEAAESLGLRFRTVHTMLYVAASLLTASVVSFSGSIGFVGLIVPHAVRLLVGPDHRVLLPVSFFAGATFLIISDILARTVIAPSELPVGAVTAALGAPLFVYLLRRSARIPR